MGTQQKLKNKKRKPAKNMKRLTAILRKLHKIRIRRFRKVVGAKRVKQAVAVQVDREQVASSVGTIR
jgi:hypothetical protein